MSYFQLRKFLVLQFNQKEIEALNLMMSSDALTIPHIYLIGLIEVIITSSTKQALDIVRKQLDKHRRNLSFNLLRRFKRTLPYSSNG